MDRIYVWIVLVAIALPAVLRLLIPARYAQLETERLSSGRARRARRRLGILAVATSPLFLLIGLFGPLRAWMWLAIAAGVFSGVEQLTSIWAAGRGQMLWHTRVFGVVGAIASVTIYFFFLRQ